MGYLTPSPPNDLSAEDALYYIDPTTVLLQKV